MPSSCIYEGLIRHRRSEPVHHQFDFRSFLLMIDLDEVDSVFDKFWLWSTRRFSFARFKADDHLKKHLPIERLRDRAQAFLAENGVRQQVGPIRILTQLSYLGFAMNPISIFYCYDLAGVKVEAVIAEVNNTPWGEQHLYLIPASASQQRQTDNSSKKQTLFAEHIDKTFHVSPFMSLDMYYRMAFSNPSDRLAVKIENYASAVGKIHPRRILDVSMTMKRKPLTGFNLNLMLIKFPFISFKIVAGIYWQALRLYLKKVPFHSHPQNSIQPKTESYGDTSLQPTGQVTGPIPAELPPDSVNNENVLVGK